MFRSAALISLILSIAPQGWSQLKIQAVVNSASFQPGMPSGGMLATIFVSGLTGTPGLVTAPSTLPLPFQLAGVSVAVNGAAAPILAVYIPTSAQNAYGQINIQVPIERSMTVTLHDADSSGSLATESGSGSGAGPAGCGSLAPDSGPADGNGGTS